MSQPASLDMFACAVLQGCLASLPNAATVLAQPQALATFIQNVSNITAAALAERDKIGQQSGATNGGGS
jgi:hypothetical protein